MNIFYLHHIPAIAASEHCDMHVGKMLIESCQMLATAHHMLGNGHAVTYKPTHVNHPSNVWVRESKVQYGWTVTLARYLAREFERRYNKTHASSKVLYAQLTQAPSALMSQPTSWRTPPLCMPVEFHSSDAILSYQKFYASKSSKMLLKYYKGEQPQPRWLVDNLAATQS
jgi:hypothetical protein